MRTINCWDDLRGFGIECLTGEACGLSMRLLCDVTAEGARLIERFFGDTITIKPGSNWNGGPASDPHVGSVMLPRAILGDLAAFILIATGGRDEASMAVVTMGDGSVRELTGEYLKRYQKLDRDRSVDGSTLFPAMIARVWRRSTDPGTGDRNEHAATGRVS